MKVVLLVIYLFFFCNEMIFKILPLQKEKKMNTAFLVGETVTHFIILGSKITADVGCSHEIKRHFLLGKKAMTNLVNVLKRRDITLPT